MLYNIFCSRLLFINWLQNHLLKCPFKYITGVDCPGCGFQRAVIELIKGNLHKSFLLYPGAIPLLLFFIYGIADYHLKIDSRNNSIKKAAAIVLGTFILATYCLKLWSTYAPKRYLPVL